MTSAHTSLITKEAIQLDLDANSKFDVIRSLCGRLFVVNRTENPSSLYQDIIKREEVVSTFAGWQTAIPHAISRHISVPSLCFARVKEDDFSWNSRDEIVRFVFLLCAPISEDMKRLRQSQSYVFSSVAQLIGQAETIELWQQASDEQVILDSLCRAFDAWQNG
ncbi:MAG: PTS sugar transporter subunit IIA [Gammaproteobacteria bacterium]|nr:PTS sugar transporter subunit IIA [Gammaproteobacteria bacterium]